MPRSSLTHAVQDHLDVGLGPEAMAGSDQTAAQLGAVVDLAVADQLDVAGLVADRLVAGRQIDDAETPLAQRDPFVPVVAAAVRTAMRQGLGHGRHGVLAPGGDDATDAAHR
jgi:hypothetical protein